MAIAAVCVLLQSCLHGSATSAGVPSRQHCLPSAAVASMPLCPTSTFVLPAVEERVSIGTAEVKAVFGSGNRKVAGCLVTDGQLRRDAVAVVKRGKRVVGEVRAGAGACAALLRSSCSPWVQLLPGLARMPTLALLGVRQHTTRVGSPAFPASGAEQSCPLLLVKALCPLWLPGPSCLSMLQNRLPSLPPPSPLCRASSSRCGASRMTCARWLPAPSAASPWRASRTGRWVGWPCMRPPRPA